MLQYNYNDMIKRANELRESGNTIHDMVDKMNTEGFTTATGLKVNAPYLYSLFSRAKHATRRKRRRKVVVSSRPLKGTDQRFNSLYNTLASLEDLQDSFNNLQKALKSTLSVMDEYFNSK